MTSLVQRAQQELALPLPAPQGPRAVLPEPSNPESPVQAQPGKILPGPGQSLQLLLTRVSSCCPGRPVLQRSAVSTQLGQEAPHGPTSSGCSPRPDSCPIFYYRPL